MITWEVFSRYALNQPHDWALDVQIILYGSIFMMAGAYTLAKNGHVRGDVLYSFFRPQTQAKWDLLLYFVFYMPGVVAMTWAGWTFANESLAIRESTFSATPLPIYPFKFVIPLAGGMLLLQGVVEIVRCVQCIRDGAWPSREQDVEEVDVDKLKAMVHVKDEDIQALDKFVAPHGSTK
jgi:TRAP-type mannitol/chloroaromatic compound transport system permease small subunit